MAVHYTGGVPGTIDADRLRNILDLTAGDRRLLATQLGKTAGKLFRPRGSGEQDFYDALHALVASGAGVQAYEAAARTVGGHQREERLGLRVRLERALAYKISEVLGRDAYLALASDRPAQRRALREQLVQASLWGALAELVWVDLMARRDVEGAAETLRDTAEIKDLLDEVAIDADTPEDAVAVEPPAARWMAPDEAELPEVPAGDWGELVDDLLTRQAALDRKQPDAGQARALLACALALVEAGERAEAQAMEERKRAFDPILAICRELQSEGVLADSVARAEGQAARIARNADRWQIWLGELTDAADQAKQAAADKGEAQSAFRKAGEEEIDDIPRLEATLAGLKRARERAGAAAERLNALLEQPPEPGAPPRAEDEIEARSAASA